MRILILTIAFLVTKHNCYSQQNTEIYANIERLASEIREFNRVEGCYLGCYGNKSLLFRKADSLHRMLGRQNFNEYFADSSVVLKYFAFVSIAKENDKVALEKLKTYISDTSKVDFEFAGQNRGTAHFNSLLAYKYFEILKFKYYYGGLSSKDGQTYDFPKKNRRQWRIKKSELDNLLSEYKVDTWLIENYCR